MIEKETLDMVVRNAALSASSVAIGFQGTGAEKTRITIERAIEALEANGMITIVDPEEWSYFFVPDPPYESPF